MILSLAETTKGGGGKRTVGRRRVRGGCVVWRVRVCKSSVCHNFQFSFCRIFSKLLGTFVVCALATCCYCLPLFVLRCCLLWWWCCFRFAFCRAQQFFAYNFACVTFDALVLRRNGLYCLPHSLSLPLGQPFPYLLHPHCVLFFSHT